MFTSAYSVRLIYLVFFSSPRARRQDYENAHEGKNMYFMIPLIVLTFFSIFIGYFTKDFFIGLGSNFFSGVILNLHSFSAESEFIPPLIKAFPFFCSVFSAILTLIFLTQFHTKFFMSLMQFYLSFSQQIPSRVLIVELMKFFNQRWSFDGIYINYIVIPTLFFGETICKNTLDRGYFSLLGPIGLSRTIDYCTHKYNLIDFELTPSLIFILILGVLTILTGSLFLLLI